MPGFSLRPGLLIQFHCVHSIRKFTTQKNEASTPQDRAGVFSLSFRGMLWDAFNFLFHNNNQLHQNA